MHAMTTGDGITQEFERLRSHPEYNYRVAASHPKAGKREQYIRGGRVAADAALLAMLRDLSRKLQ